MQMDRLFHPFAEFEVVIAKSPLFCIQLCVNTIAELPLLSTSVVVFLLLFHVHSALSTLL